MQQQSSGGAQAKRKDRMKLSLLPPKLVGKTSLGPPVIWGFIKISFAVMHLMPQYVEIGALWITLIIQNICNLDFFLFEFLESSRRIQLSQEAGFIRVNLVMMIFIILLGFLCMITIKKLVTTPKVCFYFFLHLVPPKKNTHTHKSLWDRCQSTF